MYSFIQADCQGQRSAPEPYARQSSIRATLLTNAAVSRTHRERTDKARRQFVRRAPCPCEMSCCTCEPPTGRWNARSKPSCTRETLHDNHAHTQTSAYTRNTRTNTTGRPRRLPGQSFHKQEFLHRESKKTRH